MKTNILAFYLPQFHIVPENERWWGKGFTEWTTVRNAKMLFPHHNQPREPVNYYNLLEKRTMVYQSELMKEYGVDGLCFYHYYFDKNTMILEKPAENLLKWTDIDMPFCFYWANESWARTWSNINDANCWSEIFENDNDDSNSGVLLEQKYGDEEEWTAHLNYLIPFFKDNRYIKKDGHPVFMIYKPENIACLEEMKSFWNGILVENGMETVLFLENDFDNSGKALSFRHEPSFSMARCGQDYYNNPYGIKGILDYDEIWETILSDNSYDLKNQVLLGGFVGYDDTPRRGKNGIVIQGGTPPKFKDYLIRLLIKAYTLESEYIFLNAWNEWGEGMYLEPDKKWGTGFLQAIKDARSYVEENGEIIYKCINDNSEHILTNSEHVENTVNIRVRYKSYWVTLKKWVYLLLDNGNISSYLVEHQYRTVAIYGLGMIGELLVKELQKEGFFITYGIDQNPYIGKKYNFPVYNLSDPLPQVDVVIVTVEYASKSIKKDLEEVGCTCVVTLSKILDFENNNS